MHGHLVSKLYQLILNTWCYGLEGQGDFIHMLTLGVTRVPMRVIGVLNLLTLSALSSKPGTRRMSCML